MVFRLLLAIDSGAVRFARCDATTDTRKTPKSRESFHFQVGCFD
jgi:hypothetical protein